MVQWVNALTTLPGDLSLNLGSHAKVEDKNTNTLGSNSNKCNGSLTETCEDVFLCWVTGSLYLMNSHLFTGSHEL